MDSEPHSTTRTNASQSRPNLAPLRESVQTTERARIPSGILRSTHRSAQSRHGETNYLERRHSGVQRTDPAPSIRVSGTIRRSTYTPIDTRTILRDAGLTLFELTRAEADCASETPNIGWSAFTNLFGGRARTEWMDCGKIPEYNNFFCATMRAQPFAPTFRGQPGLLLCLPTTLSTPPGNNSSTISMLSCSLGGGYLKYLGEYARRPLPEVHVKWNDLSPTCRRAWAHRLSTSSVLAVRALRTRVKLRNERNREPSAAEVEQHLLGGRRVEILQRDITAAFRKGEEKLMFLGIQCTGYDSKLATVIQTNLRPHVDNLD
ncbi:hypothetical protein BGW80DRAFT_933341 [Lactifluus volemus]|nr:hypothetical protein BGW80DRAFT_933341 [Lactifluus volemus]